MSALSWQYAPINIELRKNSSIHSVRWIECTKNEIGHWTSPSLVLPGSPIKKSSIIDSLRSSGGSADCVWPATNMSDLSMLHYSLRTHLMNLDYKLTRFRCLLIFVYAVEFSVCYLHWHSTVTTTFLTLPFEIRISSFCSAAHIMLIYYKLI